jgi:hypothetical protein
MPLPVQDSRWTTLTTAYGGGCDELIAWLRLAYEQGMTDDLLGDIINEIQHQGETSEAMYAVAPHLLALAEAADPKAAQQFAIHAGLIHCASQTKSAVPCPDDLRVDFDRSAAVGREMLMRMLPAAKDLDDFKYEVAALAGFMGHGRFGLVIEGLEFFEDQFYHPAFEEPIPDA